MSHDHLPAEALALPYAVRCATVGRAPITMHATEAEAVAAALALSVDDMLIGEIFEVWDAETVVAFVFKGIEYQRTM